MSKKWLEMVGFIAIALFGVACSDTGVGDPCVPENVQQGGFDESETYFETSSVQCATRLCIVRGLDGDPNNLVEDGCPLGAETCTDEATVTETVYCSCRCGAPAGSGVPTCNCPGGFQCEEVLETGGDGIRGSYCVREEVASMEE